MNHAVGVEHHYRPGVAMVSLKRPEQHNALDGQLVRELTLAFQSLANRDEIRVVVLTGEGRSFCAGADLQAILSASEAGLETATDEGRSLFDLMMAVSSCPMPVIGRVNGAAIGGGMGLVCCCDLVVAAERAKFGFSEVRLGLIPAIITPFVLSKISENDAKELYMTGERFSALRAQELGLVQRVTAESHMDDIVVEWVDQLLLGAPGAQAAAKELLRAVGRPDVEPWREVTSELFARRVVSREGREGIRAFLEKRNPDWNAAYSDDNGV